jgi:hypothetical protein
VIFEKIRERLQELKTYKLDLADAMSELMKKDRLDNYISREEAIDIINQVEAEYNNRWISVDDRLPDTEGVYIVTIEDECGSVRYCKVAFFSLYHPKHRWWDVECEYVYFGDVTYWMPLPEPYKKGE